MLEYRWIHPKPSTLFHMSTETKSDVLGVEDALPDPCQEAIRVGVAVVSPCRQHRAESAGPSILLLPTHTHSPSSLRRLPAIGQILSQLSPWSGGAVPARPHIPALFILCFPHSALLFSQVPRQRGRESCQSLTKILCKSY